MMMHGKSLARNSIFNMAYNLMKVVFPLIYASYVAHVLLDTGVGKVSYAQNIAQYFIIIAALGIPNYGVREVAKVRNDREKLNKIFSGLFFMNALSTFTCTVSYYLMIFSIEYFSSERLLYAVIGFNIFLNIANVDWFYQGVEEFSYIAIRSFFVKILSMIAIFAFINSKEDYVVYALISVIALAGNNIVNLINLRKYRVKITFLNLGISRHIKPVFILLGTSIAIELYTLVDTTMIGVLCDYEAVGYYTNSIKLVKILITAITSISGVLLPRLSLYYAENKIEKCSEVVNKVLSVLLFLFIPCGIGLILIADKIVPILFGESFLPAIFTLRLASLLVYALGFSNLFGTQVLLTFGQERKLLICTILGAIINLSMNLLLIPQFQQNGATVASIISETIVTIMSLLFSKKFIKISINYKNVIKSVIAVFFMSLSVIVISHLITNQIVSLILSIILGATIYILLNFLLRNRVLMELIELVLRRKLMK